jgi:cell division protein FtsI (penicillin-binding protein 3)
VADVFEPGSTIKAFTIAAALETGRYTPETLIETRGWMMVDGKEIKDSANYGTLSVERVITKSSNVGSTKIALDIGPEPIRNLMERVGLGEDTGTGFPGERTGILPNHRRWSRIETATLSYGYGLSVSALQLVRAYGVIANGGMLRPVSLVRQDPDTIPAQRVLSAEIAEQVLVMLRTVVDAKLGGTAVEANVPFYSVAGKTGTARVVGEFGYDADLHNSLFIGMAPAVNPKILVLVVVNEPKGTEQYGGQVAAPVFSRIVTGAMRILDVPPDKLAAAAVIDLGS